MLAPATPELRGAWTASCDMIVVDESTPEFIPLLKAAYGALYIPCFDPLNVDDELSDWLESFRDPENAPVDYKIVIIGQNLRGLGAPDFRSISVVAAFKTPRDYIIKDRDTAPYSWVWAETASQMGFDAAGMELEAA